MVSLTSLLVLSSLLTQTSETLPKTSYFKMVDIWLFFCIVTIFTVIIIHTASIYVDKADEEPANTNGGVNMHCETLKIKVFPMSNKRESDVNYFNGNKDLREKIIKNISICKISISPANILNFGKIVVPLAVGVFNITYWIIALVR